ncbi:hypothetical protein EDC01DRAFT_430784 [Geopyxis carbonaria]|nr:hypothetical protein EDC01DRAFT_430784 [Geopyxis carbonaria]
MATPFQNLKNFIRHGKQARHTQEPAAPPPQQSHAFTNPAPRTEASPDFNNQHQTAFSVGGQNKNNAAQAAGTAANAAGAHQNIAAKDVSPHGGISSMGINNQTGKGYDQETLARLVAEEKANRDKLPRYPGLDRYALKQKMGDGAFSNVYRARDTQGVHGEVAIKVVRKFELNASQVCTKLLLFYLCYGVLFL